MPPLNWIENRVALHKRLIKSQLQFRNSSGVSLKFNLNADVEHEDYKDFQLLELELAPNFQILEVNFHQSSIKFS